ncbi:hypothetical protein PQX77_017994, partial [Marasmius sp. AFHP31]
MYQDIALAGNGVCLFAAEAEDIFSSLQFSSTVNFFTVHTRIVHIRPPPDLQQAPSSPSTLELGWSSPRSSPTKKQPSQKKSPSPQPLSYKLTVPIRGVQLKDPETRLPTPVHILAASRLVDEHEESRAGLPSPIDLLPVLLGARQLRRAAMIGDFSVH